MLWRTVARGMRPRGRYTDATVFSEYCVIYVTIALNHANAWARPDPVIMIHRSADECESFIAEWLQFHPNRALKSK